MPIHGHFLPSAPGADKRQDPRRKLSLLASGLRHDGIGIEVQIHNISGTGLLLESDIKLASGDRIEIELPHAGDITAVVMWASGRLFGCQFEGPVSPATLSAVELKSAIDPAAEQADAIATVPEPPEAIGTAPEGKEDPGETAIDKAFGVRLQRLRTQAGLNQADVAKRMGVSARSVSGWEQGRARPKRGRMAKLASILRVRTSDLLDDPAPDMTSEIPEILGIQEQIEHYRAQVALAVGVRADRVRIIVEY